MLSKDVLMEDIDVDQWRNAQDLLLESAKEKKRIIILHDDGVIRKCQHTDGIPVIGAPERITNPEKQAKKLYEDNKNNVDFVAIFERKAFDDYFSKVQESWVIDEPLDSFIHRTYELLDQYPDTMLTYPGPAKDTLGLQYRLGISRNAALVMANKWLIPDSSLLLGIYDEGGLWTSLVLTFDKNMDVTELTTVDAERMDTKGSMKEVTARGLDWTAKHHKSRVIALVWTRKAFDEFRNASDKENSVRQALISGDAIAGRRE